MPQGLRERLVDFPENARKYLDNLYSGQKGGAVVNDKAKIVLLRRLMDGAQVLGSFDSISDLRRAYEFGYLHKMGMLSGESGEEHKY